MNQNTVQNLSLKREQYYQRFETKQKTHKHEFFFEKISRILIQRNLK